MFKRLTVDKVRGLKDRMVNGIQSDYHARKLHCRGSRMNTHWSRKQTGLDHAFPAVKPTVSDRWRKVEELTQPQTHDLIFSLSTTGLQQEGHHSSPSLPLSHT